MSTKSYDERFSVTDTHTCTGECSTCGTATDWQTIAKSIIDQLDPDLTMYHNEQLFVAVKDLDVLRETLTPFCDTQ